MKTGVVIVNYNCARYAVDAALSALGDDPSAAVVIVDNASTDGSHRYFHAVQNKEACHEPASPNTTDVCFADISKVDFSIIAAATNAGFASGCNIGLRNLQAGVDPDLYILLNPDAVLAAGSIKAFADRLKDEKAGLCGASVYRFENPDCAQALGGAHLNPWTLLGDNIAAGVKGAPRDPAAVETAMSYPLGAAMACRRDYLETVGYLDERFFLYYEEADWARRGRSHYKLAWAPEAIVYHRHGAAAGSRVKAATRAPHRSPLSDYHMARSRMLYALKWRPWLTPLLVASGLVQTIRRLLRGHWRQAGAVFSGSLAARAGRPHQRSF